MALFLHVFWIWFLLYHIFWLSKAMATYSSTLDWKIPWMEEPGGLQSMGLRRVGHDWVTSLLLFTFMHLRRKWQLTPVFLPGESQQRWSWWAPSMGSYRVGHNWSNLAAAAASLLESFKCVSFTITLFIYPTRNFIFYTEVNSNCFQLCSQSRNSGLN